MGPIRTTITCHHSTNLPLRYPTRKGRDSLLRITRSPKKLKPTLIQLNLTWPGYLELRSLCSNWGHAPIPLSPGCPELCATWRSGNSEKCDPTNFCRVICSKRTKPVLSQFFETCAFLLQKMEQRLWCNLVFGQMTNCPFEILHNVLNFLIKLT